MGVQRRRPKLWEEYPPPVWDGDCLRWQGPHHSQGYGLCGEVGNGSPYAHRVAWMREHGPIPDDLVIDHVRERGCRFRDCVNVEHLEPVPQDVNADRGQDDGKFGGDWGQADKEECPEGHAYDEANTYHYTRKDGRKERHCKTCVRAAKQRYRERRAAQSA